MKSRALVFPFRVKSSGFAAVFAGFTKSLKLTQDVKSQPEPFYDAK
jgi:hypothetical protein